MTLTAGARIGPYEIVSPLGAGGMGEVYKARDTRLDRSVAIKVLAPEIAGDPDLRARFEREARAVAALDHPHICGIYDVGEASGTHFFVMPHLEGQTLAARLEKGPLPLDQALKLASEIADALDKAHRKGIVHRDLKPANIMLTKTGSKLLDFGLAKLKAPAGPISMSGMAKLATSTPGTAHGTILGTVQYMAPEQVEGKEADARSDIWALGAVIYEMATGTRPFLGETPASIIGSILKDEPPNISARQPLAPGALDHLVSTCLAKEPDQRWQSAADVARELAWISHTPRDVTTPALARSRTLSRAAWIFAGVFLLVGIGLISERFVEQTAPAAEPLFFSIYPPSGHAFSGASASVPVPQLALSPEGRHIVFVAAEPRRESLLWLRTLAEKVLASAAPPGDYVDLRLSPDDSRVVFSLTDPANQAPDVWVKDLTRGTNSRITSNSLTDSAPLWSPAGDQIIFRSNVSNANLELFRSPPTAGAEAEAETIFNAEELRLAHGTNPSNILPTDWSPDAGFVIYHIAIGPTGNDIWALPLKGERKPVPVARTQYNEVQGAISPDSRWIAYVSDESGQNEIYVQGFPTPSTGQKTPVSTGGGTQPHWSRDGRELFYLRSDGTLMAVAVRTSPSFVPGSVTGLFKAPLTATLNAYRLDYFPARDGQRFMMKFPVEGTPPSITVVLNWTALLKK